MNALQNSREEAFWPFQQRFDKLFDSFFGSDSSNAVKSLARSGYPKIDAYREGNQYRIQAAVPGVRLDDLKVEFNLELHGIECKVLRISGKMEGRYQVAETAIYTNRELRRSHFERAFILPADVEGDPDALLDDGILTLTWATKSKEEVPKNKCIPIRTTTA